jgi:hypothetical protein
MTAALRKTVQGARSLITAPDPARDSPCCMDSARSAPATVAVQRLRQRSAAAVPVPASRPWWPRRPPATGPGSAVPRRPHCWAAGSRNGGRPSCCARSASGSPNATATSAACHDRHHDHPGHRRSALDPPRPPRPGARPGRGRGRRTSTATGRGLPDRRRPARGPVGSPARRRLPGVPGPLGAGGRRRPAAAGGRALAQPGHAGCPRPGRRRPAGGRLPRRPSPLPRHPPARAGRPRPRLPGHPGHRHRPRAVARQFRVGRRRAGDLGAAAVGYARRGIPVLPLHYPVERASAGGAAMGCSCRAPDCGQVAKHPLAALVPHGVKDASCDPAVVAAWWRRYPQANIGLATGTVFDALPQHPIGTEVEGTAVVLGVDHEHPGRADG